MPPSPAEIRSPLSGRLFDAVLFDNDGTLVNSIDAVEAAWLQWAHEFGVPSERLAGLHGKPALTTIRALVPAQRVAEAFARIQELELDSPVPVTALPGAVAAVRATETRNAIVTSADRALFERRATEAGIPLPAVTVTFDDVSEGKPDPEPYLTAAALLGADPARCLVVEDAPAGVAAGRAAGAAVLGIAGTVGRGRESGARLDADLVVPDLAAVRLVLGEGGIRLEEAE